MFYILTPLCVLAAFASLYRFVLVHNYIVEYEGVCDPATGHCFVGCDNDACTEQHFYTKMRKYVPDIYAECGADVTGCAKASVCLPGDRSCSVSYCAPQTVRDDEKCQKLVSPP